MSDKPLNIGIAGAGIMGRVLAFQLMNIGHQITLFDRDPIENGTAAAYTAAGMLAPYAEIESAELPIYHLGMQSLQLWPALLKRLNADVGFYQSGSLVVAHGSDRNDLNRFNQQLQFKLDQEQLKSVQGTPRFVNQDELSQLEPELIEKFSQATYLPDEAWLCTRCVMRALADNLLEKRIRWHAHTLVESVEPYKIVANKQTYQFDWVIDCRGLGAKSDIHELRGVRGELIVLQAPEVKLNHLIRLMHPRYRLYVVPKMKDDIYLIGATQIESCDFGEITVRSTLELLSAAYSLHSGFAEARVLECKTNCRPALRNNLPRVEHQLGLIRINGLFRHGFLLAPAIAEEVLHWISGDNRYQSPFENLFFQAS